MKKILGLGLIFVIAACGKSEQQAGQVDPKAAQQARFKKLEDIELNVDITSLDQNPYVIERDGVTINGALGHGIPEKYNGDVQAISSNKCVDGTLRIEKSLHSIGGFGGIIKAHSEVYNSANPFPYLISSFNENPNKQILEFANKGYEESENSGSSAVNWRQIMFGIELADRKKINSEQCKSDSNIKAKNFIGGMSMAMGVTLVKKVRFKDADAISKWRAKHEEHPLYSIFQKSSLSDEELAIELDKAGLEQIEIIGLQLGGDVKKTRKAIRKVKCRLKNLAGCRAAIGTAMQVVGDQLPKDTTEESIKAFRPVSIWELNLKYQD